MALLSSAPAGCLQYYMGSTGTIKSFNYGPEANPNFIPGGGPPGTRQIANTNYNICIQQASGFCSITYTIVSSVGFKITLTK